MRKTLGSLVLICVLSVSSLAGIIHTGITDSDSGSTDTPQTAGIIHTGVADDSGTTLSLYVVSLLGLPWNL